MSIRDYLGALERNATQVHLHEILLNALVLARPCVEVQLPRIKRREGQTTAMAQFAAAYAVCSHDALIDLRIPSYTAQTPMCAEDDTLLPKATVASEHSVPEFILSTIVRHVRPANGEEIRLGVQSRRMSVSSQDMASRIHVTREGEPSKDADLVIRDTEEGLWVRFNLKDTK